MDVQFILLCMESVLFKVCVVILFDYVKGVLEYVQQFIQKVKVVGVFVFIDLKGSDFECYCGVLLFMLNMFEFEVVVGKVKFE